jgi:hypothetical protein
MLPGRQRQHAETLPAWPHPPFAGAFLPRDKTIQQGFDATWRGSPRPPTHSHGFRVALREVVGGQCGGLLGPRDPVKPAVLKPNAP